MKTLVCLLLPSLICAAVPTRIAAVIDMARHAPGEFAADSLMRLATLENLDKTVRVDLLEQAFERAGEAQEPLRRRAAIIRPGTNAGSLNRAYQQQLDGLSLRLRVVDQMLPLDAAKGRELFQRIPAPQIPKLHCDDYLVYDVGFYYEVLGKVARLGFNAKQVEQNEPLQLLNQATLGITSPVQFEPLARLLGGLAVKDADFQSLLTSLSTALGKVYGDDRAFTAGAASTGPQILALVEAAKRRTLNPLPIIEAYRLYLVNNLSGERCADDELMTNGLSAAVPAGLGPPDTLGGTAAQFFNESLRVPPVQPLHEEEITPAKLQGAASGLRSCEDAECQQMVANYRTLIYNESGALIGDSAKTTPEWQEKLGGLLSALANWKQASGLEEAEQFNEKCQAYSNLLGMVPPGPDRQRVFHAWIDYLQLNHFQGENRLAWFLPVNTLIGRMALDPGGLGKMSGDLEQSRDPVIALYATLEEVAPRRPDQIMALL